MPTYQWRCPLCQTARDVICRVADRNEPQTCDCAPMGVDMNREITPAMVNPDIAPYRAVTGDKAGQLITSRKAHKEFLKRNRLVEVGDQKPADTSKFRKTVTRREIREELRRVVPEVLRKSRKKA